MAGRFKKTQGDFADHQLIALFDSTVWELRAGTLAEDNLRARALGQIAVAADEVRMQVRLDNVLYLQPFGRGLINVLVHVTLRVDDRRLALRADDVGSVRQ